MAITVLNQYIELGHAKLFGLATKRIRTLVSMASSCCNGATERLNISRNKNWTSNGWGMREKHSGNALFVFYT